MRRRPAILRIGAIVVSLTVVVSALAAAASPGALDMGLAQAQSVGNGPCRLNQPVFCDTFDQPSGIINRSGQLNGIVWGVSRLIGAVNVGQAQFNAAAPTQLQSCSGTLPAVLPPNDVIVCNGQLREATNDNTGVTSLAMYPKQPFDFGGRTGIVAFDVSNDQPGIHTVWPEFWMSDQPVPVPFTHFGSLLSVPRNGFGIRFAGGGCGGVAGQWTADSAIVVRNYVPDGSKGPGENPLPGAVALQSLGCVTNSNGMAGSLNHVEIHVSQNQLDVYATDAGTTAPLKHIAVVPNANLSFTRGLIWIEDVHYNAVKFGGAAEHTFAWDNVGFDGPAIARDLTFDVLDNTQPIPGYPGMINLGWGTTAGTGPTLSIPGVTNIQHAAAALLTFHFFATAYPGSITYAVNGHSHTVAPVYAPGLVTNGGFSPISFAEPVPLGEVIAGTNTATIFTDLDGIVSNIDLVLVGAGGGGCVCPPATLAATPTSPPGAVQGINTPTPTPTSGTTGEYTPTAPPTSMPSATSTAVPPSSAGGGANTSTSSAAVSSASVSTGANSSSSNGGGGGGGGSRPASANLVALPDTSTPLPPRPAQPTESRPQPDASAAPEAPTPTETPAMLLRAAIDENGGQLADDRLSLTAPADAFGPSGGELNVVLLDPISVPPPAAGFGLGSNAFVIAFTDPSTGNQLSRPASPLALEYQLTPAEISTADGDLTRVTVASWTDDSWVALPCSIAEAALDCSVAQLSLFAVIVAPPPAEALDMPLENGWFFRQANGFGGAGDAGYAVVDDDQAAFWTEFQRLGGADRMGYPITREFDFGGYPTQAFQKLVLQWRPELGQAVSLDIFDDVGTRGADRWLESAHHVPVAAVADDEDDEADMTWDDVVARHLAMLDPYPALRDFYAADPDATTLYGLPMTLKEDGSLVSVRLQSGILQMWTTDMPWAAADTVVVDDGADFIKAAGMWPADAVTPAMPPPDTTADSPEP